MNQSREGKLIGVTGGVGSGKSAVLHYLKEQYDCEILLADEIGIDLIKKGGACYDAYVELFSKDCLLENGEPDRQKIAAIIFEDETLLKKANAIIHPAVRKYAEDYCAEVFAKNPKKTVIMESAIFVEAGYLDMLDELWLVTADKEIRKNRLIQSRGYTQEKIDSILKNQLDDTQYRQYCSEVLENNTTLEDLYRRIDRLMADLVFGLDIGTRSVVGTVGYMRGGMFYVCAQAVREHESRSMLDGQIHDIGKVAVTIKEVKNALEEKLNIPLHSVCIAAAGRVLKTCNTHGEMDLETDRLITGDQIYELENMALEKAYKEFERRENSSSEKYYLVGYTITKQYLNRNPIGNLENQRGHLIGLDLIATFLPEDVVEGLYKAVELANLTVSNLTLEPIAATTVAIPDKYRMLNIALVDVGAGTSDICITNDGAVVAYGMIPKAGDALTEIIAKHCLVDFQVAESIKKEISVLEEVTYEDIMGLPQTITREEVLKLLAPTLQVMAGEVAELMIRLNGGKEVSAIFVVGGGGCVEGYTEELASCMGIPVNRVALRGEEMMSRFVFLDNSVKRDSMLVTPLGICLNYYDQNNNFIFVTVNGESVKLYNNGNLHVSDALMQMEVPNEEIFPKRGRTIRFTVNGENRLAKGSLGEAAMIKLNGEEANIHSHVRKNDMVEILFSTKGEDVRISVSDLAEYRKHADEPLAVLVNGHVSKADYDIQNGDIISIESFGEKTVTRSGGAEEKSGEVKKEPSVLPGSVHKEQTLQEEIAREKLMMEETKELPDEFHVTVNGEKIIMKGKDSYIFVDIFDYIDFDLKDSRGRKIITRIDGVPVANYMQEISKGAVIDVFWENIGSSID